MKQPRRRLRRRLGAPLLVLPLLAALPHEGDAARLRELDARLASSPCADLYLERAELHAGDGRWSDAMRDLDRARRLEPRHAGLRLARARVLVGARLAEAALPLLDAELAEDPEDRAALELRARAHALRGERLAAVDDLDRLLALSPALDLERVLSRARLLEQAARADGARARALRLRALSGIEVELELHGCLHVLELEALALEQGLGRSDAALARIDRLAASQRRQERWHARRAEVLRAAGRVEDARAAYRACLDAIRTLPPRHRETRAMADLRRTAETGLDRIARLTEGANR